MGHRSETLVENGLNTITISAPYFKALFTVPRYSTYRVEGLNI